MWQAVLESQCPPLLEEGAFPQLNLMLSAVDVKLNYLVQVWERRIEMMEHKLRHAGECALTRGDDLLSR